MKSVVIIEGGKQLDERPEWAKWVDAEHVAVVSVDRLFADEPDWDARWQISLVLITGVRVDLDVIGATEKAAQRASSWKASHPDSTVYPPRELVTADEAWRRVLDRAVRIADLCGVAWTGA